MVRDANLLGRFPCELSCPIKKHTLSLLLYAFKYTQYICVYVCCRSLNCLAWLYKSRLEKRKIFTVCWARVMSMRGCCYLQPKKKTRNYTSHIVPRLWHAVCSFYLRSEEIQPQSYAASARTAYGFTSSSHMKFYDEHILTFVMQNISNQSAFHLRSRSFRMFIE